MRHGCTICSSPTSAKCWCATPGKMLCSRSEIKRSHRCAQTGGVVARESAALGVSRRPRHTHGEGTGAQLHDHHQGSHARDGSDQSSVSQLGHSLRGPAGIRSTTSPRVAGENRRSRGAPPRRANLSPHHEGWLARNSPPFSPGRSVSLDIPFYRTRLPDM